MFDSNNCPKTCPNNNLNKNSGKQDETTANYEQMSLTHLDNLEGMMPINSKNASLYGARIIPIATKVPFYERSISRIQRAPWFWLAQLQERTFMNRTKALNEPPVETYKELRFAPIPQDNFDAYIPLINTLETNNWNERFGKPDKEIQNENFFNKKKIIAEQ